MTNESQCSTIVDTPVPKECEDPLQSSITRWGNSLALRLPKGIAADAHFVEGDPVDIRVEDGALVVRRSRPKYDLDELLDLFKPEHHHTEPDFGAPRGLDVW